MKKSLMSLVALALLGSSAIAADLPRNRAPVAPPTAYAMPVFTWTGFYVGATAGYENSRYKLPISEHVNAFTLGLTAGYNWQLSSNIVLGLETDMSYGFGSKTYRYNANDYYKLRTNFLGTTRVRVGYAIDRVLLYVTGGFAYGNPGVTVSYNNIVHRASDWRLGYAVGGGVEYAINRNWSAKLEGLYYNLGKHDGWRNDGFVVRTGVNYKF